MCDVALGSYYSRQGETHRGLLGWFVYFKVLYVGVKWREAEARAPRPRYRLQLEFIFF